MPFALLVKGVDVTLSFLHPSIKSYSLDAVAGRAVAKKIHFEIFLRVVQTLR